jgi:hypothetical protein
MLFAVHFISGSTIKKIWAIPTMRALFNQYLFPHCTTAFLALIQFPHYTRMLINLVDHVPKAHVIAHKGKIPEIA